MPNNVLQQGVSAGVGVLCLVMAIVLWVFVRDVISKPQMRVWVDRFVVALVIAGVLGILSTKVGGWLRSGVAWVNAQVAGVIGSVTGATITFIVALIAFVIVVAHLITAKIGKGTFTAAVLSPVTVAAIPGPLGAAALATITAIGGIAGAAVAALFGMR